MYLDPKVCRPGALGLRGVARSGEDSDSRRRLTPRGVLAAEEAAAVVRTGARTLVMAGVPSWSACVQESLREKARGSRDSCAQLRQQPGSSAQRRTCRAAAGSAAALLAFRRDLHTGALRGQLDPVKVAPLPCRVCFGTFRGQAAVSAAARPLLPWGAPLLHLGHRPRQRHRSPRALGAAWECREGQKCGGWWRVQGKVRRPR